MFRHFTYWICESLAFPMKTFILINSGERHWAKLINWWILRKKFTPTKNYFSLKRATVALTQITFPRTSKWATLEPKKIHCGRIENRALRSFLFRKSGSHERKVRLSGCKCSSPNSSVYSFGPESLPWINLFNVLVLCQQSWCIITVPATGLYHPTIQNWRSLKVN